LIAPELIVPETWNAIWKRVRQGRISPVQARRAIPEIPVWLASTTSLAELFPRAAALSLALDHPIYDCFYLALAEREAAPLVTADDRLLGLAGRVSVEVIALATAGRR
jgi:predicted nucleic acid-binding protein